MQGTNVRAVPTNHCISGTVPPLLCLPEPAGSGGQKTDRLVMMYP